VAQVGLGLGLGLVTQVRVGMVSVGMVLVGIVRVGMVTCTPLGLNPPLDTSFTLATVHSTQ